MKIIYLIFIILIFTSACHKNAKHENKKDSTITFQELDTESINYDSSIYVPKNLFDCFKQLDKIFPDSTKNKIKSMNEEKFSAGAHFGIGLWIRNFWIRNKKDTSLRIYFHSLGIFHPDDMSGIILDSYHRYLLKKEIKLEEQIIYYKNYWEVNLLPDKKNFPSGAKKFEFNLSFNYKSKNFGQGCIHIGTSPKNKSIWLYDFHYGWAKASYNDIITLENNTDNREEIIKALYKINKTK